MGSVSRVPVSHQDPPLRGWRGTTDGHPYAHGLATAIAAVEVIVAIAVVYDRTRGNMALIDTPVDHFDQRVDRAIHALPAPLN
jgi:hypothetical protein